MVSQQRAHRVRGRDTGREVLVKTDLKFKPDRKGGRTEVWGDNEERW